MNLGTNERDTLIAVMSVCAKLGEMDDSIVEDIEKLNSLALYMIPGQSDSIEETILVHIRRHAAEQSDAFEKFIASHLDRFKCIDVSFVRNMMILDGAFGNVPTYAIESILNAPRPKFSKAEKEFQFYHTLSNRAIQTGNSELIRRAIERVQSL